MTQYWYSVVPRISEADDTVEQWAVYAEGLDNARRLLPTKREAVTWAKNASKGSGKNNPGVVVHDSNGWPSEVWVNSEYMEGGFSKGLPPQPPWSRSIDWV